MPSRINLSVGFLVLFAWCGGAWMSSGFSDYVVAPGTTGQARAISVSIAGLLLASVAVAFIASVESRRALHDRALIEKVAHGVRSWPSVTDRPNLGLVGADADRLAWLDPLWALVDDRTRRLVDAQNNVQKIERHVEEVLRSVSAGVVTVGDTGAVLSINGEAIRLMALTATEKVSVGQSLANVVRDHEVCALMIEARRLGRPVRQIIRKTVMRSDGADRRGPPPVLIVRVTAVPFALVSGRQEGGDVSGPGVLFFDDETDAHVADSMRRDFVTNVSHELRTPLTSLSVLVESLQEGAVDDPEVREEFLRLMRVEVDSLTELVLDILELSAIETGHTPVVREPADPAVLVQSAHRRLRAQAARVGIDLRVAVESTLPLVSVDAARIGQVLLNLVQNAIKFTAADGSVTIYARRSGSDVRFSVVDTGIGLRPEDLTRVFERFYKVDRSRASSGTGLGLAIAKHLVQAHDGKIGAESPGEGGGATIWFTIPLWTNDANARALDTDQGTYFGSVERSVAGTREPSAPNRAK